MSGVEPKHPAPLLRVDGTVEFESAEAFRHHLGAFLERGCLLVRPERPLRPFESLSLRLVPPKPALAVEVKGEVASSVEESVLIRLIDFDVRALRAASEALGAAGTAASRRSAPEVSSEQGSAGTSAVLALLKGRHSFKNPQTPHQWLALPVSRAPSAEQLAAPPLPLVLRFLPALRANAVRLAVSSPSGREVECFVIHGKELRSAIPPDSLLAAMAQPGGTYEVASAEPGRTSHSLTLQAFRLRLLRELLKKHPEEDLAAAMSGQYGSAPRLTEAGAKLLPRLPLSDAQRRVARTTITGERALAQVLLTGIGEKSSWQLVYLLQLLGGLEWVEVETRDVVADELEQTLARVREADHFAVLEAHFTSSPKAIEKAYRRMKGTYGPGSQAQRKSPGAAEEICRRVEAAYAVIKSKEGRRAYRAERFPKVRMDYAASLVHAQAQMAQLRGDLTTARDLLEAAIELHPCAEYLADLQRMR